MKQFKIKALNGWINKFSARVEGGRLAEKDLESLNKLTLKQLDAVLALVSTGYTVGCSDTRQWHKEHKEYLKKISE